MSATGSTAGMFPETAKLAGRLRVLEELYRSVIQVLVKVRTSHCQITREITHNASRVSVTRTAIYGALSALTSNSMGCFESNCSPKLFFYTTFVSNMEGIKAERRPVLSS